MQPIHVGQRRSIVHLGIYARGNCSSDEGQQEVEAKKRKLRRSLRLGDMIQEA